MPENIVTIQLEGVEDKFLLHKKVFSTSSKGYHAQGKMQVGDKRYQCNFLIVEIGSKSIK